MANNKLLTRLQQFFGWNASTRKTNTGYNNTIEPVAKASSEKDAGKLRFTRSSFPSKIEHLWDWYLNETADTANTLSDRLNRYRDMDYMIYNDSIISMALNLYADEVAQPDDNFELIKVNSPDSKITKAIKDLFDKLGITQKYIREVTYNLCAYGDSFDIVDIDEKLGVVGLTPIDVYDVTDRLEFKASEIKKRIDWYKFSDTIRDQSIRSYISKFFDSDKEETNPSSAFISYLFGFVLCEDTYVAPWQILHYRLESRKSEFWPWGRPMFINLIGPWRQLKTSMNLLALARTMKFPKDIFKVHTSEEMTQEDKWEAVNLAREQYSNIGRRNRSKEEFALADEVWVPDDFIDFETKQTDISLDDIADVELLRDNIMMGTSIPKGYLITDEGGWGTSNQSLLQQSKPFGRVVYRIESEILERLSYLVKLHFILTNQFEGEFTEFELSMNFPIVEEAQDRLQLKSDTLDLATAIINNLKDAIGYTAETVPVSLVKKVFSKYSFLSQQELDKYIAELEKEQKKADAEGEVFEPSDLMGNGGFTGDREVDFKETNMHNAEEIKKYMDRINEDTANAVYFEAIKQLGIKEAHIGNRHVYASQCSVTREESKVFSMYRSVYPVKNKRMDE